MPPSAKAPMRPAGGEPGASADPNDLIVRIAASQDRDGFTTLFLSFAPKVKSYFLRFGVSDPLAEELAQETMFRVWRSAPQFDPAKSTAAGWIFTIARNLGIDTRRRERHPDDLIALPPVSTPATPEQALRSVESERMLHRALSALPLEQAEVIKLAFLEEQTHSQIADRLGLPLGTVKSRIRLATAHLRHALDRLA